MEKTSRVRSIPKQNAIFSEKTQADNAKDVVAVNVAEKNYGENANETKRGETNAETKYGENNVKTKQSGNDETMHYGNDAETKHGGTDLADQPICTEKRKKWLFKISPATITKTAMLTAISFLLYAFGKFNLPMIFPSFLEIQFSELPALLAGFSMGPLSGAIVIIAKCLLKFPMSSTGFVGEATDIIIGLCFVLPASFIYKYNKTRKNALIGLGAGVLLTAIAAIFINRFISIPFYVELFFKGNWDILLGVVRPLYANITKENFYAYYLGLGVVPFNLLRSTLVAFLTFLLYKRLSGALHWEFPKKKTADSVKCNKVDFSENVDNDEEGESLNLTLDQKQSDK